MSFKEFIILGAGINGLCCAYRLSQVYPEAHIKIISEHFSPNTTSDVAAGLWEPYLLGDTPKKLVRKWSKETYDYFHELWKSGLADECGICLVPWIGLCAEGDEVEEPFWKDFVFGFQQLSERRLLQLGNDHAAVYISGVEFVTFTCEPTKLLQFYTKALKSRGAVFHQQKIDCFQELGKSTGTIVINCLGLGSEELLEDRKLQPSRGQVRRVRAPWMFHVFATETAYVIPNTDSVTLGGTKQAGDYDTKTREEDANMIKTECAGFAPALQRATVVGDLVGLRPTRSSVRLEVEWFRTERTNSLPVVHNYGHGGSGITLAWGCAGNVLHLVHNLLINRRRQDYPRSLSRL